MSERYLAGFVDAEGSLMISRSRSRRYDTVNYRARATVSNTQEAVPREIRDTYGGILVEAPRVRAKWKSKFELVWTNGMVEDILARIQQCLRVKAGQAELLQDFIRHMKETPQPRSSDGRSFARFPLDVMEFRETLYRCMRTLNARGRIPSKP